MSEPLKPCPWCNSPAVFHPTGKGRVCCSNTECDAFHISFRFEFWNRRVPASKVQEGREKDLFEAWWATSEARFWNSYDIGLAAWQARAAAQSPLSRWMPIESASKDGDDILVARFEDDGSYWSAVAEWWVSSFAMVGRDSMALLPFEPTHWQPLPPPPAAAPDTEQEKG